MSSSVRIDGDEQVIAQLRRSIDGGLLRPATRVIAAVVQDRIAPYPTAPARRTYQRKTYTQQRWYERGFGPKWSRKNGSINGRKTSEMLGRRWSLQPTGTRIGTRLINTASYAALVHSAEDQTRRHAETGWVTDEEAAQSVVRDGTAAEIVAEAIQKELDRG